MTLLVLSLIILSPTSHSYAAISTWQRGASIQPTTPTQFATPEFKQSLIKLKANNANYVNLVIPIYQYGIYDTNIWAGGDTPTDDTLVKAIGTAHSLGLKVSLKPHIESKDGQWRAKIDPANRTLWFENYGAFIKRYAAIAQAQGAEQFIIGTELIALTAHDHNVQNTPAWRALIAEVRKIYTGKIVYAANWGSGLADEKNRIAFWDAVDVVGIDAYYPLGGNYAETSVENFRNYWAQIEEYDIKPFQQKVNRPIVFTEVGYRSTNGTHIDPGNYHHTDGLNQQAQANLYEALFSFWNDKSYIDGIHVWNWDAKPDAGGANDPDYTPQNKLAEPVMKKWFGTTTVTTFPISLSASSTAHVFSAITSVPPGNLFVNTPVNVDTKISTNGTNASNIVVDVEIYDSSDRKVFQKFYENQTILGTKSFTTTWTPTQTGNYKVKVGVFNYNWTKNFLWQDVAQQFTVKAVVENTPVPAEGYIVNVASTTSTVSQAVTVNALIRSASSVSDILADIEVYNSFGEKVAQNVFENQTFGTGESKQYSITFTPQKVGTYTVKVGIFSNGWATNKLWVDNAGSVTVTSGITVAPPALTIMSPSGNVTGVQFFKAYMTGLSLSDYVMFWQVDGDRYNDMYDAGTHKEAIVDLTNWNWKGHGPYNINFVAKDKNGNVIGQKGVDISI